VGRKIRRVPGQAMGLPAVLALTVALASSACTVATVGEGTATSSAALVTGGVTAATGGVAEAGVPLACGVRFVGATGDASAPSSGSRCRSPSQACATIQQAIAAACPGDVVMIGAGRFAENVVVDKPLSLVGAGDATVIVPAESSPAPCNDSSLCGGAASSVVLVRANDVTIVDLAIDGNNPALTSGTLVRGVDVDARNGVVTDTGGPFNGLEVRNVTVTNVYLRGIEASSGGTFAVEQSRVANLADDPQAVAIFDSDGAGRIEGNLVVDAAAAIATNRSQGTRIAGNTVRRSATGIHSDNAGLVAGSSPDVLENNVVSDCTGDGFGVWSFAPYVPVTVRGNRVSRCSVGLAELGQNAAVHDLFVGNQVDGGSLVDSIGLYVSTSLLQYGASNVGVRAAGNTIENASVGVYVQEQPGFTASVVLECDTLTGDDEAIAGDDEAVVVHGRAECSLPAIVRN
jgi:hypothetical protein